MDMALPYDQSVEPKFDQTGATDPASHTGLVLFAAVHSDAALQQTQ